MLSCSLNAAFWYSSGEFSACHFHLILPCPPTSSHKHSSANGGKFFAGEELKRLLHSVLRCNHTHFTTIGFQPWEAMTVWCFFSLLDTFTLGYSPQPKDILLRSPYLLVIFNSLFIVNQPLYEKFPFHITLRYLSTDWIRLIHSKANTWVYFQDGRVEGLELTSSHENTKSQVTAEQPSAKKTDIYLKRYSTSRDKEDSRRGTYSIQSNPIPAGWVTHK